ncbi:MAG: hypothetical protein ABSD74_20770 [Rhizomicrobium sp.]|jgi:hypothetical protein
MSRFTIFLARFIGLFAILIVAGVYVRGTAIIQAALADAPLMFTYAIVSLALGLAMVLGHNAWRGGVLPVVVTLVGWLILAKGLTLLFLKPDALTGMMQHMQYGAHPYLTLAPAFVIGLYLTVAGFLARVPDGA